MYEMSSNMKVITKHNDEEHFLIVDLKDESEMTGDELKEELEVSNECDSIVKEEVVFVEEDCPILEIEPQITNGSLLRELSSPEEEDTQSSRDAEETQHTSSYCVKKQGIGEGLGLLQSGFVDILKEHSIILSNCHTPADRKRKTEATEEVRKRCKEVLGIEISEFQIQKKIRNMKSRLKRKLESFREANNPIVLKKWEKKLLSLLRDEGRSSGAVAAGASNSLDIPAEYINIITARAQVNGVSNNFDKGSNSYPAVDGSKRTDRPNVQKTTLAEMRKFPESVEYVSVGESSRKLERFETDNTRDLSYSELQRYVLLKQVRVLEQQEEKVAKKKRVLDLEKEVLALQKEKLLLEKEKRQFEARRILNNPYQ